MAPRIVVLDGVTLNPGDNPWSPVEELGELTLFDRTEPDEVLPRLGSADIAIVNKVLLPDKVLHQLPQLKFIAVTATGYDCVDVAAAAKRGIPVSNVPTYGTDSVAQFAFALLLELCHHVGVHDSAVRSGDWERSGAFSFWKTPQVELAGLTLGIIGFGRIGRRVGELGHAFGMSILAHDVDRSRPPAYQPFAWADLDRLASESDAISLHCNLTPQTNELINASFLSRMKSSAFLLNAARGRLVNESALAEALNSHRIAGAAVDVVSTEPIRSDNPLLTAKNCLITPHIAWSTNSARRRMMQTTAENIQAFLAGRPINVVNGVSISRHPD